MAEKRDTDALRTREQRFKARKWDKMFVSRSVITSKAFLALKTAASCQVFLIFLNKCVPKKVQARPMSREKEWRITNNGELQFTYIEAEGEYGIPGGKFTRAIDDLVRVGLIDITRTGLGLKKEVSLYAISNRWEKFGTDGFVVKTRPKRTEQFGFAGRKRH